jgi:hypothetical protein
MVGQLAIDLKNRATAGMSPPQSSHPLARHHCSEIGQVGVDLKQQTMLFQFGEDPRCVRMHHSLLRSSFESILSHLPASRRRRRDAADVLYGSFGDDLQKEVFSEIEVFSI